MLQIKNIVKLSQTAKVLPVALNTHQQKRGYAHQIPERLQSVPTAQNPKFFDMVKIKFCEKFSNFHYFFLNEGGIFLPPWLPGR